MAKKPEPSVATVPKPRRKRRRFPVEIWAGGSLIRILRDPLFIPIKPPAGQPAKPNEERGKKKYDSYLVEYHNGSKRKRKRRGAFENALALANQIKVKLLNGEVAAAGLVGRDQQIYLAAVEHLRGVATVPLDQVAKEYTDFVKMFQAHSLTLSAAVHQLDDTLRRLKGTPMSTIVEFFETHGRTIVAVKTVPEVITEMLKALKDDKVGDYHIRDLRLRLNFFASAFPGKILEVTTAQIDDWLRGLKSRSKNGKGAKITGKTRNNYRASIIELFNFARKHHYLSFDLSTAADQTKAVKAVTAENEIFTPEEMGRMLPSAPGHLLPSLAIKALSGVRTEEMIVLDWKHIKFDRDCIALPKTLTKLDQRRLIRLKPNLKAWLLPYRKSEGRIAERWTVPNSLAHAWKRHGKTVNVETGKNKFRNSFISYRLAETNDIGLVAMESGNSPKTIERDYLEVTTPEEAKKWFSIFPPRKSGGEGKRLEKTAALKPV